MTATPASGGSKGGENTGRWTAEEHRLFLQGLEQHGKGWKKIASLIKSRTVVQIRTHAQKYFQKLAKARQNGEDGDVPMDGRGVGGVPGSVPGGPGHPVSSAAAASAAKRRRQTAGTKRKAITSVVASAQREGKRLQQQQQDGAARAQQIQAQQIQVQHAATGGMQGAAASLATTDPLPINASTPPLPPLPAVAPALAPFVVHKPPVPTPLQPPGVPQRGHLQQPALAPQLSAAAPPHPARCPSTTPHPHAGVVGGTGQTMPGITTPHGSISGQALEDSL